MQTFGWIAFGTAMLLVVLHRDAAKAYLTAYEGRYGTREPGARWLWTRDADPAVERLRRRRLLLVVPASVLVLLGIWLLVFVR